MGDKLPVTREKKREPVVAVGNRSSGFPTSGGRVLGVHGSGSFHGPFSDIWPAGEKTTSQEAPGTTIDSLSGPDYSPHGVPATEVVTLGHPVAAHPGSSY